MLQSQQTGFWCAYPDCSKQVLLLSHENVNYLNCRYQGVLFFMPEKGGKRGKIIRKKMINLSKSSEDLGCSVHMFIFNVTLKNTVLFAFVYPLN